MDSSVAWRRTPPPSRAAGAACVIRRPFAAGLLAASWTIAELVLVALGTGAIIFDGLSQTQLYFDLFIAQGTLGDPIVRDTIVGGLFLGTIVLLVLSVARSLSVRAVGAGLLPVALGYLVAHYLTYLLVDGQRIIAALNDPLLRGNNLLPFDLGSGSRRAFCRPRSSGASSSARSSAATSSAPGPGMRRWRWTRHARRPCGSCRSRR